MVKILGNYKEVGGQLALEGILSILIGGFLLFFKMKFLGVGISLVGTGLLAAGIFLYFRSGKT